MRRLSLILVLFFVIASFSPSYAHSRKIDVGLNRAELISLRKPMAEVMIANPEIADIVVHGAQKISVIGKDIGSTNLRFFDEDANLLGEYDVIVGHDLPGIRRSLKKFFPDQSLGIETINNSLAVTGVVPDAQTANRVMQVVHEFVKESRRSGVEDDKNYSETDNRFPGIVNLLTLNSGQQVMLKVKIGEVQRTALKELGFNLNALEDTGSSIFQFATGLGKNLAAPGIANAAADTFGRASAQVTRGGFTVGGVLDVLERDGLLKTLAEPNLTTVSGETASFLAGGEFPIPTVDGNGQTDVKFKQFGVTLSFTPFVLTQNRIRMTVSPELSELDTANQVTFSGGQIPALVSRRAVTTVELAPGEAFMIAGLIRDNVNTSIDEVPGIAEVPIISSLFRSSSYRHEETELVISVTPYIVDPIVGSDIRLPTDEYRSASVMEMFFYGALGSMVGDSQRIGQTPVLEGPIGYMVE